jgi:hypothetical protein
MVYLRFINSLFCIANNVTYFELKFCTIIGYIKQIFGPIFLQTHKQPWASYLWLKNVPNTSTSKPRVHAQVHSTLYSFPAPADSCITGQPRARTPAISPGRPATPRRTSQQCVRPQRCTTIFRRGSAPGFLVSFPSLTMPFFGNPGQQHLRAEEPVQLGG